MKPITIDNYTLDGKMLTAKGHAQHCINECADDLRMLAGGE